MPTSESAAAPLVSVIVPTRDCLQWLPRAMSSIGSRPDVEIVVFDDGSTDGTQDWLAEASVADPRIVVLQGDGIGPSKARNRAIAAARGRLLAFLDADDRWYPGKLDLQIATHLAWPEVGFSFTDYRHVTEAGEDFGPCFGYWPRFAARIRGRTAPFALGGDAMAQLFAENVVGTSTVMARTDLVRAAGGFSEDMPSSEDWDLWLRLAQRSQVMCLPQTLADYLMHRPGSVTRRMRARVLAVRMIGARHEDAVRQISGAAVRCFTARLMDAEAEMAQMRGEFWQSVGFRAGAFAWAPSRRGGRELAAAAARALRARRWVKPVIVPSA